MLIIIYRNTAVALPTGTHVNWETRDYPHGPPRLCPRDAAIISNFTRRTLVWGCALIDNDQNNPVRGRYHHQGQRLKAEACNEVEIGLAACPTTNTSPPHVSIVMSLPRRVNTEERYFWTGGRASNHNLEFRLFSGNFKVALSRFRDIPSALAGPAGAFCVEFTNIRHPLFIGHPWPFRGPTADIHEFFWGDV